MKPNSSTTSAGSNPILIDTIAAQVAFGIKPTRIRQWAKRGKIQPQGKRGRCHLYADTDIAELLDRHIA